MKKKYVYFVPPLIGLVLFAGVYWKFAAAHEQREANMRTTMIKAREEKIRAENILKKKAVEDALVQQEIRKKQKAEKETKELEERDRRERAALAMANARDTATRKVAEVRRLEKQVEDAKKEIARVEQEKKASLDEQAFIRVYVQKAEANQKGLAAVLQKIEAADRAAEEAARAAAAAAAAAAKKK